MSVWFAIPSKRTEGESQLRFWRAMGYNLALWRDAGDPPLACTLLMQGSYPGYAKAVNALCKEILVKDPAAEWIVTGGDDVQPDQNHPPGLIAAQCTEHFGGTIGVMQPTGDGHSIEMICGSPWLGREWCIRAHQGTGPLWHEYTHQFVDQDLQEVATKLGILWQRPDLRQRHNHWTWTEKRMPKFLREANSDQHWEQYKALFFKRRSCGFPGHEPLSSLLVPPSENLDLGAAW